MPENSSKSAIVLTPTGSDGLLIGRVLGRAGIAAEIVQNAQELCRRCEVAAGVVVVAEEALCPAAMTCLGEVLTRQPAWSDLPLIVLTGGGQATRHSTRVIDGLASKGNVTPLERPLRMLTLVSTVRRHCGGATVSMRSGTSWRPPLRRSGTATRSWPCWGTSSATRCRPSALPWP